MDNFNLDTIKSDSDILRNFEEKIRGLNSEEIIVTGTGVEHTRISFNHRNYRYDVSTIDDCLYFRPVVRVSPEVVLSDINNKNIKMFMIYNLDAFKRFYIYKMSISGPRVHYE